MAENKGKEKETPVPVDRKKLDEALKIVHQENMELRHQLAQMGEQVQRIQRIARVDEHEGAVGMLQSNREVLNTMANLTRAVTAMADRQVPPEIAVDREGQDLFLKNREYRMRQVRQRVNHLRYLLDQSLERTYLCPCERHMGVKITDKSGQVLVENECPLEVWKWRSRVALEDGTLYRFNTEVPLSAFLKDYALT